LLAFGAAMLVAYFALEQLTLTEDQVRAMENELHRSRIARLQDNKPTVVIDRRDHPERGTENYEFVLCNIGRGFAVNVYDVTPPKHGWRSLGGLAAGAERPVPPWLQAELTDTGNKGRFQHIIIAEGPRSRTRRWNPTLNLLRTDGTVIHLFTYPQGENDSPAISKAESRMELDAYLEKNVSLLAERFVSMP
jgi:hypothetical protein